MEQIKLSNEESHMSSPYLKRGLTLLFIRTMLVKTNVQFPETLYRMSQEKKKTKKAGVQVVKGKELFVTRTVFINLLVDVLTDNWLLRKMLRMYTIQSTDQLKLKKKIKVWILQF